MATPAFVQGNTYFNSTAVTSATCWFNDADHTAHATAGNLLVVYFLTASSRPPITPSGWTALASQIGSAGTVALYLFTKVSDGTETSVTITTSATYKKGITLAEYVGQAGTVSSGTFTMPGTLAWTAGPTDAPATATSIPVFGYNRVSGQSGDTYTSPWVGQYLFAGSYCSGGYAYEPAPNAPATLSATSGATGTSDVAWINVWVDPTSTSGTTVALTGQSAATAQGSSAPTQALSLSGQQASSGQGATATVASAALLGLSSTLALGLTYPVLSLPLSGLAAGVAQGIVAVSAGTKQIILTSGTNWTVPSDWNNSNNKIECVAAGAAGGTYGGGGGAYARKNNLALTPGANISVQVGTPGTYTVASTWFGSTSTVFAAGPVTTNGGLAASSIGDVVYSGGSASTSANASGGGGAGGPNGAGVSTTSGNSAGGAGDAGFGGTGSPYVASGTSSPGGNGTEWGTAGSGGGGGGNGTAAAGNPGGAGGNYGGGGGGSAKGVVSAGAPGVIVITYTPAPKAVVVPLVGSSALSAVGAVGVAAALTLAHAPATAFAGGLLSAVSGTTVALSGIASSWSVGSTLPGASALLAGRSIAAALGTLTVFTSGVNIALTGSAFAAQSGAFKPQSTVAASGLAASVGKGTLTVIGGNVYVALVGQASTAMLGRIGGQPAGLMLTGLALSTGCCRARLVPGNASSLSGYTITTRSGFLAANYVRNITAPLVGMAMAATRGTMTASTGIVL